MTERIDEYNYSPTKLRLTLEVVSPVLIATGDDLYKNKDYVTTSNTTWVLDHDAIYEALLSDGDEYKDALLALDPGTLLQERVGLGRGQWTPELPYFRYVLPTSVRKGNLLECIKDAFDRPYIPGSSIKGALRTLLMWYAYTDQNELPDIALENLGDEAKTAASLLERSVFVASEVPANHEASNYDILRSLRVSDSHLVSHENASLDAYKVKVFLPKNETKNFDIWIEAITPGTELVAEVSVEEYGFTFQKAASELGWNSLGLSLRNNELIEAARFYGRKRLLAEGQYHRNSLNQQITMRLYADLLKLYVENKLEQNEWLMQIGWGTGWEAHTLGNLIRDQGEADMGRLVNTYQMMGKGKRFRRGQPFPKTRKLIVDGSGAPTMPLGWVRCRLDPID